MNIKKTLFKTDNEKDPDALLMKLIKSTTIPGPEKEKVMLALTNAEQSMDTPKPISTKEEKRLNVLSNVIINSIRKSKKGKTLLALTDANPSMNISKTILKKDSEELLRQLIKSTTIPKPEKEKVLLDLTNNPHSSNKIINIIEKSLGHKVTKIVPFLSQPSSPSSSASTAAPSSSSGAASSSAPAQSDTKQKTKML